MTEDTHTAENAQSTEQESRKFSVRLTLDKRIDLAIMVVIVLFGVFLLVEAGRIDKGLIDDPLTSRGMPYLSGITFVICGLILGVLRVKNWKVLPGNLVLGEGHEDEEGLPASWVRVFLIVLVTWLSVWLLPSVGYLIATPLFLIFAVWLMGTRDWKRLILFPVLYTLVTWYIFSQPLNFVLPLGFLAPFFRSLGLTP